MMIPEIPAPTQMTLRGRFPSIGRSSITPPVLFGAIMPGEGDFS